MLNTIIPLRIVTKKFLLKVDYFCLLRLYQVFIVRCNIIKALPSKLLIVGKGRGKVKSGFLGLKKLNQFRGDGRS